MYQGLLQTYPVHVVFVICHTHMLPIPQSHVKVLIRSLIFCKYVIHGKITESKGLEAVLIGCLLNLYLPFHANKALSALLISSFIAALKEPAPLIVIPR